MANEKRKTKTSSAVKNRYNNRVYGSIIVRVPKEMAQAFKEKCAETGTPQAQIVKKAIEEFLAKYAELRRAASYAALFLPQKEERKCTNT